MVTHLDNAKEMAKRAIAARELVYRGIDEAKRKFARLRGTKGYPCITADDEKQKFLSSAAAKTWISDNRWHIDQSIMYSALSTAEDTRALLVEARRTNGLLAAILQQDAVHEAARRS